MAIDEKRRQKQLAKKAAKRKAKQPSKISQMRINHTARSVANFPIYECVASTSIFENGLGTAMLTRKLPDNNLALSMVLIDSYCLGVKNAMFRLVSISEYLDQKRKFEQHETFETIHPSCLRKMVNGAIQYAKNLGFTPHPDYTSASLLFGDIDATACPVHYEYGLNGEPCYMQGPNETDAEVRKIMRTLARNISSDDNNDFNPIVSKTFNGITYKVSNIPLESPYDNLPQYIRDKLQEFHEGEITPQEALNFIVETIERYPDVPDLHNQLCVACIKLGELNKALEVAQKTYKRFPNYLFGRIALAEICISNGYSNLVPELFEHKYDLNSLYPERDVFHFYEIIAFHGTLSMYFHIIGNQEQSDFHYNIIYKVDPNHPTTKKIKDVIYPSSPSFISKVKNFLTGNKHGNR